MGTTTGAATPEAVARHTAAAEELAASGRWEEAYAHLRSAMQLLRGYAPADELDRLRREHAEAAELARRDGLTATWNRRYLDERLLALVHAPSTRPGLSLAIVDADHFKQVNDTFGHLFGDRVLQRLVALLGADLPEGAFCARYGGEEFALVLPEHDLTAAVAVCEAVRERIDHHPWAELAPALRVTVSAGVAHSGVHPPEVERLVGTADGLLYAAKAAGRNAVAFHDPATGLVRLAGEAARRRGIPQGPWAETRP
jgi:diguanylate cyclase (GGDEF)-like protein